MKLGRILKHLCVGRWQLRRAFPKRSLRAIGEAIREAEIGHCGEIRFAVEPSLDLRRLLRGQSARERALEVFSHLRVWDTEHNSGVLIYVQLVDRRIEIVADRGIAAKVAQAEWDAVCRGMEAAFRKGAFLQGALEAIQAITRILARHFPPRGRNANELPDKPVVL